MAERLDMTLDDIIKNNKKSAGSDTNTTFRGGGPGRSRGLGRSHGREPEPASGPTRRVDNRVLTRMKPYFVPQAFHVQNVMVGGESSSEAGTRLYISNLDYEVTNEDIKLVSIGLEWCLSFLVRVCNFVLIWILKMTVVA
ncbi:putative RNA-binding domain superfamily [Helianthus annuus]|nr:putative RNA-binding domain superfamily [Helianthus annuus]